MRRWPVISALLLAVGVAVTFWAMQGRWPFGAQSAAPKAPPVAIPVAAATVLRADVPIYLTGLGTVQAFNSVLLKTRVDGQIVKINFSEGQDVRAGDILVEIDPQPFEAALAQAQAAKLKDQAQLDNARLDLDRATRLAATGSGSKQQLDTTRALVAQLEATIQADQAMIDSAQIQVNYSRIRSPLEGRTGARLVDAGNIVRASDATGMVTINQIHPISVDFSLPSGTLPAIRAKFKSGEVAVTAQDSNGKDLATGKLTVIDNQVNATTATIRYKAAFDNMDDTLWPGQFVNVRLQLDVRRDAITVPVTTVQRGPDGTYVFVINRDRVVQKRPVKVGFVNKTLAVIDDGLQPGEQVVTEGQYRIQAGSTVGVLPPAEPPK